MNPFMSFCLYVAARVFVQYLKSRPKDQQVRSSLQFLLTAMQALRRRNPLTESFLVQLDVDLEGTGLEIDNFSRNPNYFSAAANVSFIPFHIFPVISSQTFVLETAFDFLCSHKFKMMPFASQYSRFVITKPKRRASHSQRA